MPGDETEHAGLARVDALFEKWDRPDSPGGAVGIVRDGVLIYSKGFGTAHLDYQVPNTPTTIFELGSAAKGFTSACAALLMDQGRLDPDDDLRELLPEMRQLEHPVRIRHMLRCESGLWAQFHVMPLAGWPNVPIHTGYSKQDLLTVLSGQRRLPFEPGTDFQYSSSDFFLLGIVIERITGQTLAQFAREQFFEPLGMTRTYYEEDPGISVRDRAVGHWKSESGWAVGRPHPEGQWRIWQANGYIAGGGGVRSCIEDLDRWDQGFTSDVLPRGRYLGEFLSEGTVLGNRFVVDADAYRKHTLSRPDNPPPGVYRGLKRMQFTGGFWGMTACISRFPEQRLTVICLSNCEEVSAIGKAREIADLLLAEDMEPVPTSDGGDTSITFVDLPEQSLQRCVGDWRQQGNSPIWRTQLRDGDLHLVDHLDKAFRLWAVGPATFKAVGENPFYESARFAFDLDADGPAERMTLSSFENGFHEVLPFDRVELVDLDGEELSPYAGTYVSDELGSIYRFRVDDGSLWLRVNSRRWERLRPLVRDEFTLHERDPHEQRFYRFTRDEEGVVDGLSVGFWRVRGIRFEKWVQKE